jgi:hypothetical protein
MSGKINYNENPVIAGKIREVEITLAEYRELVEAKKELEMIGQIKELQNIVDTLKKYVTFEDGTVFICISEYKKEDRDFIVKALELKEEEQPNE